jgi:hypothetical protein
MVTMQAHAGFFDRITDTIGSIFDGVKDTVGNVVDVVVDISDSIEDGIDTIGDISDDIAGKIGKTIGDLVLTPALELTIDQYLKFSKILPGDFGDQALGVIFVEVLKSDGITNQLLRFAKTNPAIITLLIHTINENPELLDSIAENLERDNTFGELFTELALMDGKEYQDLAQFFFDKINATLYRALTINMVNSKLTSLNVAKLMEKHGADELQAGRPFNDVFFDIGSPADNEDGNELSNERLFFALMQTPESAALFVRTLFTMDIQQQQKLLEFSFNGTEVLADGSIATHKDAAFFNAYAITSGIALSASENNGPVPAFDLTTITLDDLKKAAPFLFKFDRNDNIIAFASYTRNFLIALFSADERFSDEGAGLVLDTVEGMVSSFVFNVVIKGIAPVDDNAPAPHPELFDKR